MIQSASRLLHINPTRFQSDFTTLSAIGATLDGGVDRPALSAAHLAARTWFAGQVQSAGLEFHVDKAGNHSAILRSADPAARTLLLGSHLDSVPNGGCYDGALGVLAALEVLRTVQDAGLELPVHLEAIDFTDEEGTLVGFLGSKALTGKLTPADLQNPRGGRQTLLDGFSRAGLAEVSLFSARRDPAGLAGYLELHIEQGPRLNQSGIQIGVVTGIVGIVSHRLSFTGRANHAGTTPMTERKDAGLGAASFMLAAHQMVLERFPDCVVNIGSLHLTPGSFNIVPGSAEMALECRSANQTQLSQLQAALLERARTEADRFGLGLEIQALGQHLPAPLDPLAQAAISAAAEERMLTHTILPSGAGHDAQNLADLCPSGMVFIPSVDGVSHSPNEFSHWEDCLNGGNVLLGAALRMAWL